MREHTETVIKVTLDFHVTDSAQTVEPSVGAVLNQYVKALFVGAFYQTIATGEGGLGVVELTIAHGLANDFGICNLQSAFFIDGNPQRGQLLDDRIAELITSLWSVFFDVIGIHRKSCKGQQSAALKWGLLKTNPITCFNGYQQR